MPMNILLIEDLAEPAQDIIDALKTQNCEVVWISGVDEINHQTFYAEFEGISGQGETLQHLDLRHFDIALIDFEIDGAYHGGELVSPLRKSGVVCVGISAKANLNGEIMAAGAHLSVPKHALADQIRYGQFDLEEVVETFSTDTGIPDEEIARTLMSKRHGR